jgi:hypothetical protein
MAFVSLRSRWTIFAGLTAIASIPRHWKIADSTA